MLLAERDVAGIGIDTLSLDPGNDLSFPVHNVILAANKYQIENLNNLDALPARGAVAVVGVLPFCDGSQAQARVIGLME
jgi:kynurenine formamidase